MRAFAVHRELGAGLLESTYRACLVHQLKKQGMRTAIEVPISIRYDNTEFIEIAYKMDVLVENAIVLELKAVEALLPVHRPQLLTCLRHADKRIGLLINFSLPLLKNG